MADIDMVWTRKTVLVFDNFFYCNYFQNHHFFLEIWVKIKIIK